MPIAYEFLADRPDAIPVVAGWYFSAWGHLSPDDSLEATRHRLLDCLNRDSIPFILLATDGTDIVAAARLKDHELIETFPDRKHWLGGVYVAPGYRGQGHGTRLIERVAATAPRYGVESLYLQTQTLDGGLYARLGWVPVTAATNRGLAVLVMVRRLADRPG